MALRKRHALVVATAIATLSFPPALAAAQDAAAGPVEDAPPASTAPAPATVAVVAADERERDGRWRARPYQFDGLRITPGLAYTEDIDPGFFGRIEFEAFSMKRNSGFGPTSGMLCGFEAWGGRDGGGGGLPCSGFGGYRTSGGLFASLGLGLNLAIYDQIRDDGGFGIFAPLGTAALGIDGAGYRVLADFRAQYRWEWGAEDRYQLLVGLSLSFNDEDAPRPTMSARR